ncbi:MAG: ATP-binding cassette domain-containing protein [Bdellovibrionota bacterium]
MANEEIEIEFKDIWKKFPSSKTPTLAGMSFQVKKGTIHVLLGHSGAGKSVTLKHLLGLVAPDKGEVIVKGQDIGKYGDVELTKFRRNYGMLFQNSALFDGLNVMDNVAFPLREHNKSLSEADVVHRVEELLASVDLKDVIDKMPSELSGGMRKRVGLARAIALGPQILLFDEPTTGLDPETSRVIDDLIVSTTRRLKATSLIISHDINASLRIADFVSMIWEGKIIETASPADFVKSKDPVVSQFLKSAGVNS